MGGSVAAPQPVKAFNHVGLGPTDEERSRELARMDKPKYKHRKLGLGEQPGSVSAQADGFAVFAADRAFFSWRLQSILCSIWKGFQMIQQTSSF